jgi:putative ABC transport system permease protein
MKLNGKNAMADNLKKGRSVIFRKYNPAISVSNIKFVDETYAQKFDNEQRQGTLAASVCRAYHFYIMPWFIWPCHIYGRKPDKRNRRAQSIRRVGNRDHCTLLSKDFLALVVISLTYSCTCGLLGNV